MFAIVQNKEHVIIHKLYGRKALVLVYYVYKTQEDFENGTNWIQKVLLSNSAGTQAPSGSFTIYESAYGLRLSDDFYQDVFIILDGNPEKEALEDRMENAVLAEFNGGIIVPYGDLFKFSVEVVSANTGETLEVLQGNHGNTWVRRSPGVYIPTSGSLAGKPCMRLNLSYTAEIISKENKETGTNNRSVRLDSQRPYIVFISGLQVPHLENSINSMFIDPEDYSKTYYCNFT